MIKIFVLLLVLSCPERAGSFFREKGIHGQSPAANNPGPFPLSLTEGCGADGIGAVRRLDSVSRRSPQRQQRRRRAEEYHFQPGAGDRLTPPWRSARSRLVTTDKMNGLPRPPFPRVATIAADCSGYTTLATAGAAL